MEARARKAQGKQVSQSLLWSLYHTKNDRATSRGALAGNEAGKAAWIAVCFFSQGFGQPGQVDKGQPEMNAFFDSCILAVPA
jgi:hypothetical protein